MAVTRTEKASDFRDIGMLFRARSAVRVINLITLYRIVTFPLLVVLAIAGQMEAFKWFLLASFITDAIDGFLARRYQATSILGAKLDSIGDDLTVLAAALGLFLSQPDFVREQWLAFAVLFALFLAQVGLSFYRYGKMSTFHTYLAKIAAVVTAIFLLSVFFLESISYPLFYSAAAITGIEIIEEILLVLKLREYKTNVKGLFWVQAQRTK
jgi:CDP-diacylglycerol--glycerol-3-phosphate 3-phosphatidyltransferase